MNKKKENGFFKKNVRDSRILNCLYRLGDKVYKTAGQSLIGGFLSSYDKSEQKAKNGFFANILSKLSINGKIFSPFKKSISKGMKQSVVLAGFKKLCDILLSFKVSMLGLFMLAFGASSLFVRFLKIYLMKNEQLSFVALLIPVVMCASALPMLFSSDSIASSLCDSRLISFLLFDFLGIKRVTLQRLNKLRSFGSGMLLLGAFSGALTYFVSVLGIIAFMLTLIGAAAVLASPETGIVLLLLGLPFISSHRLAVFVFFIFCAYMFKLLCGKRTLKFDILGISVLLFALLLALGGFISFDRSASLKPSLIYVCFIAAFFLVTNLIKSSAWLNRCTAAIVVSSFAACVYGVIQRYVAFDSHFTFRMPVGTEVTAGFASPEILGTYLIMALPFALTALISAKSGKNKFFMLIALAVDILCLLYTVSRSVWLGFAVGLIIFFIIYTKKTLAFGLLGLCALPAVSFLIPKEWISYISSVTGGGLPLSDRLDIWHGTLRMIKYNFLGGVGTGSGAFSAAYPRYALHETEGVSHSFNLYLEIAAELGVFGFILFICIILLWLRKNITLISNEYCPNDGRLISCACVSGIAAALINGCTDHIWSNYRVFLMFWIVMALAASAYGIYMREIEKKRSESEFDTI